MISAKPLREGFNVAVAGGGPLICVVNGPGSITWISRVVKSKVTVSSRPPSSIVAPEKNRDFRIADVSCSASYLDRNVPAPATVMWPHRGQPHQNVNNIGVRLWTDRSFDQDRKISGGHALNRSRTSRIARLDPISGVRHADALTDSGCSPLGCVARPAQRRTHSFGSSLAVRASPI